VSAAGAQDNGHHLARKIGRATRLRVARAIPPNRVRSRIPRANRPDGLEDSKTVCTP
jgi:hypothetical protein